VEWFNALSNVEKLLIGLGLPAVAGVALYTATRPPSEDDEEEAEDPLVYGPVATAPADLGLISQLSAFEDAITAAILAQQPLVSPDDGDDIPPVLPPTDEAPATPQALPASVASPMLLDQPAGLPARTATGTAGDPPRKPSPARTVVDAVTSLTGPTNTGPRGQITVTPVDPADLPSGGVHFLKPKPKPAKPLGRIDTRPKPSTTTSTPSGAKSPSANVAALLDLAASNGW